MVLDCYLKQPHTALTPTLSRVYPTSVIPLSIIRLKIVIANKLWERERRHRILLGFYKLNGVRRQQTTLSDPLFPQLVHS